jgi:hypothetical protein
MENAYYYFFSAVPQVLAGIIALFGVFVIFKLQALSNELSPIVSTLYDTLRSSNKQEYSEIRLNLAKLCFNAYNNKSFKTVSDYFKTFDNNIFSSYPNYTVYNRRFINTFNVYEDLFRRTVCATTFTGILIVICLALLPFAKFLSCYTVLIFIMFAIIIACVSTVFCLLVTILKKSLK